MKNRIVFALICAPIWVFLSSLSGCDPEPIHQESIREQILGTWYASTSNIAGSSWYELTFYEDGTGKYTNERPYTVHTASFMWTVKGNQIHCSGYMATVDSDNNIESDIWQEEYTFKEGRLYWKRISDFPPFQKLGAEYPDEDESDDFDKPDNETGDDIQDEPKPEFVPFINAIEKLPQRSDGNKYCVLFDIQYGGTNILSAGIKRMGFVITVESGYFDGGDPKKLEYVMNNDVEIIDDKMYYWTFPISVYGTKSNPIRIKVQEIWTYRSHSTRYLGAEYTFTAPYDSSKDDGSSNSDAQPIQPGTSGTLNGHQWVDLGLSVKWATMNIGAKAEYELGTLFQWTKDSERGYRYNGYNFDINTKYSAEEAVKALWGDGWRLPTKSEMQELIDLCDAEWDYAFMKPLGDVSKFWPTINGVEGAKVWGNTGQSLFLPYAQGPGCAYWTSQRDYTHDAWTAACIGSFQSNVFGWQIDADEVYSFHTIRAVCK